MAAKLIEGGAKFDGKCVKCQGEIAAGSPAMWDGPGSLHHPVCPEKVAFVDAQKIHDMMQSARTHRKFPTIDFRAEGLQFKIAGPRSRYHGSVLITDAVAPNGAYFGRINFKTGAWIQAPNVPQSVVDFVTAFAADPATIVGQAGRDADSCCFCDLALTDERSRHAGYGPTCAKNYGIPWGEVNPVSSDSVEGSTTLFEGGARV